MITFGKHFSCIECSPVLQGLNHLPPADKMDKIIEKDIKANLKR